jgi:hypothetical protein
VTKESGPFLVRERPTRLVEMPDTGALADYTTVDELRAYLDNGLQRRRRAAALRIAYDEDVYLHIGFHQETAAEYVDRVIAAVAAFRDAAGDEVVVERLGDSVAAWLDGHLHAAGKPIPPGPCMPWLP